jgi:urease accessory protein
VTFGCVTATLGLAAELGVMAFLWTSLSSLTAVATRLVPLGPTEGQKLLRGMHSEIAEATRRAAALTADELTSSVPAIDIAGMRHERLYSRLYMS